jgi:hypothetical protein
VESALGGGCGEIVAGEKDVPPSTRSRANGGDDGESVLYSGDLDEVEITRVEVVEASHRPSHALGHLLPVSAVSRRGEEGVTRTPFRGDGGEVEDTRQGAIEPGKA